MPHGTVNLAAITGALTAGPEAHPDPDRRWVATSAAGRTYLVLAGLAPITSASSPASTPASSAPPPAWRSWRRWLEPWPQP